MPNLIKGLNRVAVKQFQTEVLDWEARVVSAGGTVSAATKDAVEFFTRQLKDNGLWTLCQEIGVFAGSNLAAALVKLKYVTAGSLTNVNFVSGDYTEQTGLAGNGTTKYLDTGFNMGTAPFSATGHFSFYLREALTGGGTKVLMGAQSGAGQNFLIQASAAGTDITSGLGGTTPATNGNAGSPNGFYQANRISATDLRLYRNGAQVGTTGVTNTTVTPPSINAFLWALNNNTTPAARTAERGSFYSIGTGMTASQAATFHAIVQRLQTDLGRAV